MAKGENGYAQRKGAIAAARKVLGSEAVIDHEFEVFEIEGGRFDWKAVERKRAQRRTSGKPSPFPMPTDALPNPAPAKAGEEAPAEPEQAEQPNAEPAPTNHGANVFGAAAMAALSNTRPPRDAVAPGGRRTSDKGTTEKRVKTPPEIVNGVRKPSVGTVCRAVWDELDKLADHTKKTYPDSKQVRELAERMKWNSNNASIEFYQWRKFHGITGRAPKAAPAAKPVKTK